MATPVPVGPSISQREIDAVTKAMYSGYVSFHNPAVIEFEENFTDYVGVQSFSCSSGTAALHLALLALGVGHGDEVIVPNLTFGTVASVVIAVGAKPVLVDVREDFCIDTAKVVVTEKTKAIIAVHLYGNRCDVETLMGFGVPVIEDCCEALGYVTPVADIACFSFFANKVITTGEGGMVCSKYYHAELTGYRDGGFTDTYEHYLPGLNYRITGIQAALGIVQLDRIDEFLDKRQAVLDLYQSRLPGQGKWLYLTKTGIVNSLELRQVFYPLHWQKPFRQEGDFHNSCLLWKDYMCLPVHPDMEPEHVHHICDEIEKQKQHEHSILFGTTDGSC